MRVFCSAAASVPDWSTQPLTSRVEPSYERMRLWTNDPLVAARRVYRTRGFELTHEEAHQSFGVQLIGQTYELELSSRSPSHEDDERVRVGLDGAASPRVSAPVFYFDFNSPYAYLAARRVDSMFSTAPAWRPIAFAFLLKAQGRVPWSLDSRRAHGVAECERRAADRGLPPLRLPPGWPDGSYSLLPLRAAVLADREGRLRPFALAAFDVLFVEGRALHDPAEVAAMASVEPERLDRTDVKDTLKTWTEEAMAAGVPGVPTVLVGNVPFWGDDHLEDAASAAAT